MTGIILHCHYTDCQKIIIRNANLPVGTSFEVKCAHCGRLNYVCSTAKNIIINSTEDIIGKPIEIKEENHLQKFSIGDTIFIDIIKHNLE